MISSSKRLGMITEKDMNAIKVIALMIMTNIIFSSNSWAKEVHIWDKSPIEIKLQKNVERIIQFPSNVKIGMSPALRSKLTMTNAAGVLYIKPTDVFDKTRIFATLDNDEILILDMFSVDDGKGEPLGQFEIIHPNAVAEKKAEFNGEQGGEQQQQQQSVSTQPSSSTGATIKELLQYAVIDLYGPYRLLPTKSSIVPSEIKRPLNLEHVFIKRSAGLFDLKAFKQYRTANYTLTAIQLRNRTAYNQNIVLTDVYPVMLVNSSYETFVKPRSNDPMQRDSTTFFIVTKKPLTEYSFYAPKSFKKSDDNKEGNSNE